MSEKIDVAYETAEMSGDYRGLCELLLEDNQRLQAALREIRECYRSLDEYADEDDLDDCILAIDEIAKEALGDE